MQEILAAIDAGATGDELANVAIPGQSITPGPTPPPEVVYPGRFIPNGSETNDTSDRANNLGTVTRGTNVLRGLKIQRNALNLPDYDWYKFRIQRNGQLTVQNIITNGQALEMTLWRRRGNDLSRIWKEAEGDLQAAGEVHGVLLGGTGLTAPNDNNAVCREGDSPPLRR